jgi:two-component system sensor histidine kinase/response regulator
LRGRNRDVVSGKSSEFFQQRFVLRAGKSFAESCVPRNSRQQLLNMLDSIAEGIYCIDLDGQCTYCNARCLRLLGYDSSIELLGRKMHPLIHHHHRDGSVYTENSCRIYEAYHNDCHVHVTDEIFFRRDGRPFDVEYWGYPIKEDGVIVGAVVSFTDITLKRSEDSHRNHLAQLVEASHDAIISRDLEGRITSWNQGAKRIYGYDTEEVLGQTIANLSLLPESEEEVEIRNAFRDGTELPQFEVCRRRKNGEVCDISLTMSPIFDADNRCIGFASVERDITEDKRAHDAVVQAMTKAERAEQRAQRANQSRADFLANVSHELRTPMNAILGMLRLSLAEQLDPVVSDYLAVAKYSADALLDLVNELLDFAKIESGNFEISADEFDVREAIDGPAKVLATKASEKGLEVLCEIDSKIPAKLIGDGRRISQVITNLLSNAIKFTEAGEIVIGVRKIRRMPSEFRLRFSVADTGIGIAPEHQKTILLPFQQADMSSTRAHPGTGLGLSICRELVSLMGGQLQFKSEVGTGSRFWFDLSLPVADEAKPADKFPRELVDNPKVLIVDDNPTNLRILEKIFVSWSMQPIVAESAEVATRILNQNDQLKHEIALVLVDCLMPQVDGFEFAEKFAEDMGDDYPPIVLMQSAADLSLFADRKLDSPVTKYLTKPISQSELLNTVVDTLDLYSNAIPGEKLDQIEVSPGVPARVLNILLVEDLPANQKVATAILGRRGHRVVTAPNGRVGLEKVFESEAPFDVILMDVQMPVMDGLQATAAIRASEDPAISETPIIAMTAHAMQGDRETCLAAGMDAYLSKPLDARTLIELTETIVEDSAPAIKVPEKSFVADHAKLRSNVETTNCSSLLVDYSAALKRLGGDRQLFSEFVEIFSTDAPKLMRQLSKGLTDQDCGQVEKAAHALKGLMLNFGAKPCCEMALEFELAGRNRELSGVKDLLPQFERLYHRLGRELNSRLVD